MDHIRLRALRFYGKFTSDTLISMEYDIERILLSNSSNPSWKHFRKIFTSLLGGRISAEDFAALLFRLFKKKEYSKSVIMNVMILCAKLIQECADLQYIVVAVTESLSLIVAWVKQNNEIILSNPSVEKFLVVEFNDYLQIRCRSFLYQVVESNSIELEARNTLKSLAITTPLYNKCIFTLSTYFRVMNESYSTSENHSMTYFDTCFFFLLDDCYKYLLMCSEYINFLFRGNSNLENVYEVDRNTTVIDVLESEFLALHDEFDRLLREFNSCGYDKTIFANLSTPPVFQRNQPKKSTEEINVSVQAEQYQIQLVSSIRASQNSFSNMWPTIRNKSHLEIRTPLGR